MTNVVINRKSDFVKVPRNQYILMKKILEYHKKQMEIVRIMEVEESIRNKEFKSMNIDDFINKIN